MLMKGLHTKFRPTKKQKPQQSESEAAPIPEVAPHYISVVLNSRKEILLDMESMEEGELDTLIGVTDDGKKVVIPWHSISYVSEQ